MMALSHDPTWRVIAPPVVKRLQEGSGINPNFEDAKQSLHQTIIDQDKMNRGY